MADAKPYTEAESFFMDASYYKGYAVEEKENDDRQIPKDTRLGVEKAELPENMEVRKKFYFVPKHLRQPGQPPLTLLSPDQLKVLQSNFTIPLPYTEREKPFPVAPKRF